MRTIVVVRGQKENKEKDSAWYRMLPEGCNPLQGELINFHTGICIEWDSPTQDRPYHRTVIWWDIEADQEVDRYIETTFHNTDLSQIWGDGFEMAMREIGFISEREWFDAKSK